MKRSLRVAVLTIGVTLALSMASLTEPAPGAFAQAVPSPSPASSPSPVAAPVAPPAAKPAGSPATTTPAPRAGGFPVELAWPLMAGGAAAVGAGALLLRRNKR